MVILHNAIKIIQNDFLKNKNLFLFKTPQKKNRLKKAKIIFFLLIAGSGTSHVTISLIGFAPHT